MEKERPKVGVGLIIKKEGKILLGKRLGSHGGGMWAPPGGHLEFGETWEECALRELAEEVGISVKNIKFDFLTNDIFYDTDKHYITILLSADFDFGETQILEPEKCEKWEWFGWDNLPVPLFLPIKNAVEQGYDPFKN